MGIMDPSLLLVALAALAIALGAVAAALFARDRNADMHELEDAARSAPAI